MQSILRFGTTLAILSLFANLSSGSVIRHLSAAPEADLEQPIKELYVNPWPGARLMSISPMGWAFNFTEPMKRIVEIGSRAQDSLLPLLGESQIKVSGNYSPWWSR